MRGRKVNNILEGNVMCGEHESLYITSQIKADEQNGVAQNGVALMWWVGKKLRGEQNVQTATFLYSPLSLEYFCCLPSLGEPSTPPFG